MCLLQFWESFHVYLQNMESMVIFHTSKVFFLRRALASRASTSNQLYLLLVMWLFNQSEGAMVGTTLGTDVAGASEQGTAASEPKYPNFILIYWYRHISYKKNAVANMQENKNQKIGMDYQASRYSLDL